MPHGVHGDFALHRELFLQSISESADEIRIAIKNEKQHRSIIAPSSKCQGDFHASLTYAGCLLILVCSTAMAGEPEIFPPARLTLQQTQPDLREQEGNLQRNSWDAAHDQRDINRDEVACNTDKSREERDLSKGDLSDAKYWNQQRKDENAEIRHDKADLDPTYSRATQHAGKHLFSSPLW